jgi:hypothetical protein
MCDEAEHPSADDRVTYVRVSPSAESVWHIVDQGRRVQMQGGQWRGEFQLTFCGHPVPQDGETTGSLAARARLCQHCLEARTRLEPGA